MIDFYNGQAAPVLLESPGLGSQVVSVTTWDEAPQAVPPHEAAVVIERV